MNRQFKNFVIVGGGTAGWLTANLMAKRWEGQGFNITLVESPNIDIVGVGEGSTPPLKHFFDEIGVDESEWMKECDATYKVGIEFPHWSTKPGFESYFHPFFTELDRFTAPAFFHNNQLRRQGVDLLGHPDPFFLSWELSKQRLAPVAPPNFPFEFLYGYHFDSGKLGKYLQKVAARRGVKYQQATINDVALDEQGYIDHLKTEEGEDIKGDFFVDCTGLRGHLIRKALGVPFEDFGDVLFNDSALVFPTEPEENPIPQTTSTALKYGWIWKIPLTTRFSNGYVYSSRYVDDDEAEKEMREHLGLPDSAEPTRRIKFKIGRVREHWAKNCLGVGLAQGFIEPLEATAIALVQVTAARFIEFFNGGGHTERYRGEFNNFINTRFEAVRDYIVGHYHTNSRTDTDYWIDNRNNEKVSEPLRQILRSWSAGNDISEELKRYNLSTYFPDTSWHCLLAGSGTFPDPGRLRAGNEQERQYELEKIDKFMKSCALNFSPHKDQLAKVR
ncbi:MAG: tryptophan halogenase family protein [Woeseiaceae bacterium]